MVFVHSFNSKAKCRCEVFLVSDHHVDKWRQLAINSDGLLLSANRFPE
jgi:hypothetical protein